MELTKNQEQILIAAVKSYRTSKVHYEAAQKNMAAKLDKLKEACQGSGSEPQVLETAYRLLAEIYINRPEDIGLEA